MSVAATMYRSVLKGIRRLSCSNGRIVLREPVDTQRWGQAEYSVRSTQAALLYLYGVPPSYRAAVDALFDGHTADDVGRFDDAQNFAAAELTQLARSCFDGTASSGAAAGDSGSSRWEDGFLAMRLLAQQQLLQANSSVHVSKGVVRVECTSWPLPEESLPPSHPEHGKAAFCYRISIENMAGVGEGVAAARLLPAVKLTGRQWFLQEDGDEAEQEIAPRV
jgi:hypothetical protein